MSRDFAKKSSGRKKTPARKRQAQNGKGAGGWRWYFAGVLSGCFLSFLLYLSTLPGEEMPATAQDETTEQPQAPPKPRFDFYTMLPEQTIEDEVPATQPSRNTSAPAPKEYYLLQAGSFRQREDADRRRAELLLLGLQPSIEETSGENGRWFRVFLGPYESRSQMSKARSLTAAQNIDTLLLKRSG